MMKFMEWLAVRESTARKRAKENFRKLADKGAPWPGGNPNDGNTGSKDLIDKYEKYVDKPSRKKKKKCDD
jgi:hypothetical protein